MGALAHVQDQKQVVLGLNAWSLLTPKQAEQQGPDLCAGSHPNLENQCLRHRKNLLCSRLASQNYEAHSTWTGVTSTENTAQWKLRGRGCSQGM